MVTNYTQTLAQDVIRTLITELSQRPYVGSATLIGVHPEAGRHMDKINDLDLVLIVEDPLTQTAYEDLSHLFDRIQNYSQHDTSVVYRIADGPMKPETEQEKELFVHTILHTPTTYKASPLALVKHSWQQEKPLLGKPLSSFDAVPAVTLDMLLNDPLGIRNLRLSVMSNTSGYLSWDVQTQGIMTMKMHELDVHSNNDRLELYYYTILRCASNTLRYLTKDSTIGIDEKCLELFEKSAHPNKNLPREVLKAKRALRQRQLVISETYVQNMQQQTIKFLDELEKMIQKK